MHIQIALHRCTNRHTYAHKRSRCIVDLALARIQELQYMHTQLCSNKMQVCDANSKQMVLATFKTFHVKKTMATINCDVSDSAWKQFNVDVL